MVASLWWQTCDSSIFQTMFMVWLLCSMCQLVTAVRLILKFLSINSHCFPIKFPWANSKQLVKPFCECALSLFCSPALEVMRLFCSWVLELCSALLFVPNAMQAEAGRGHWKAQRHCVLEMFKNRTGGLLWCLVWLVIGSGAHLVYELWSCLSLRIWISISAFYKIIWKSSFFSVFFCFGTQERQDGTV